MRRFGRFAQRWVVFAIVVAVWELVTRSAADPFFPPPSTISGAAAEVWFSSAFGEHVVPGVGRMLGGWALAGIIGVALGLLLGRSRTAMAYLGPLFNFMRSIPPPLLVPFFIATVGVTSMQLPTIIFGAIWPVLLNTVDGARGVDATKVETARAFRLSKAQWILGVVLPSAAPKIFAGLRLSLSISLILMVIGELVGSANGIGNQLVRTQRDYDLPEMWSWIVLLGVLGYLFNTLLLMFERRALAWQPKHTFETQAQATGG
ncbi:ABC-type nitrate/sulfonate/bicarbonate transport system, permease component [Actinokineospora alba]|uniref:ABC-type nitrate/sulfonate/bicarbonate transport system, permease component n=1 Tax=Actinokineospora alba TaxID=504798 RepID=A0A1H0SCL3_9PSEU|nr:ABC transporter permease [Actinokineospora alba]TDP66643.1 ABC-type nitrate/sulfonate/bicarbonate transport system permease component [Actinokineospora alba]SDI53157.1 ABC-type nitrate/sulfonate/bicarbonate transport system, permease component [Actinokineospora alba]SDP39503.1 ABC-type nitrate/sulfonate/bicarbonate transport system, permease component [Actinokineospora alba]